LKQHSKYIKRVLAGLFSVAFIISLFIYQDQIINYTQNLIVSNGKIEQITPNAYTVDYEFMFIKNTNDLEPKDKQDLLNIYYTLINSGQTTLSFYCPNAYNDCLDNLKKIAYDNELLSHINNFAHPFNSFKYITTKFNNRNHITIELVHNYTPEKIEKINAEVDKIEQKLIKPDMNTEQKIRVIHDHIIDITRYDVDRANKEDFSRESDTAYGPLFQGYAICSGYSDLMAIFLNRWQVPNYRIASENHIWNLVYVNHTWLHLDLTWNDPVMPDGSDVIDHTFFLITNEKLQEIEPLEHRFPTHIYIEGK